MRNVLTPWAVLALCLLWMAVPPCALAQDLPARWKAVHFGVGARYAALHDIDATGRPGGYLAALLPRLAAGQVSYNLTASQGQPPLEQLRAGTVDVICGLFSEAEAAREGLLVSREHYGVSQQALFTLETREDLRLETFRQGRGLRIGFLADFPHAQSMADFVRRHDLSYIPVIYGDPDQLRAALEQGDVDAVAANARDPRFRRAIALLGAQKLRFYTTAQRGDLLAWLDGRLAMLFAEDPHYQTRIAFDRFGQTLAVHMAQTEEEARYVREAPVLRVAVGPDKPPSLYFDEEKQTHRGLYMDVLRHVERVSGLRFRTVQARTDAEAMMFLDDGRADLYLDMPSVCDATTASGVRLSTPFSRMHLLIVGRENLSVSRDALLTVGINLQHPLFSYYIHEHFPRWSLRYYENTADCLNAIHEGQCDVFLQPGDQVGEILEKNRHPEIRIISSINETLPIAMALPDHQDPRILAVINKALAALDGVDYAIMEANNELVPLEHTAFWRRNRASIQWLLLTGLLVVFAVLSLSWYRNYRIAYRDHVTGLPNRRSLAFRLRYGRLNGPAGRTTAVILLEVANLRRLNEYFGDAGGDKILVHLAGILVAGLPEHSEVYRYGGDLFLALAPCPDSERFARRLTAFSASLSLYKGHGMSTHLGCVMGVCLVEKGQLLGSAVYRADYALREARESGRPFLFYDDALNRAHQRDHSIELEMEDALTGGAFHVYYQPKFDLRARTFMGSEALVRWKNPDGQIRYYPDSFIPVFEKTGFIVKLDFHVLEHVCATLRVLMDQGVQPRTVSVNQSRVHLNDPEYCARLEAVLTRYRIPPGLVELELTEYTIMEGYESRNTLDRLRYAGFAISMDDFGSGYSSLNLLRELPIDVLKLDKRFLADAAFSQKTQSIIRHIIAMSMELRIEVICEGVETDEQVEFLLRVGCRYGQGFLFSRAVPEPEFLQRYYGVGEEGPPPPRETPARPGGTPRIH